jgi:hypothetical protein
MEKKSPDDSHIGNGHSSHTEISPGRQAARRQRSRGRSGASISADGPAANGPTRDSPTRERSATASVRRRSLQMESLQMRNETRTRNPKRMRDAKQTGGATPRENSPEETPSESPQEEGGISPNSSPETPFSDPPSANELAGGSPTDWHPPPFIKECLERDKHPAHETCGTSFQKKSGEPLQQAALLLCLGKTTPPKTTPPTTAPTT